MTKIVSGGLVAIILPGLYVYATVYSILAAQWLAGGACPQYSKDLNEGVATILNLVGRSSSHSWPLPTRTSS